VRPDPSISLVQKNRKYRKKLLRTQKDLKPSSLAQPEERLPVLMSCGERGIYSVRGKEKPIFFIQPLPRIRKEKPISERGGKDGGNKPWKKRPSSLVKENSTLMKRKSQTEGPAFHQRGGKRVLIGAREDNGWSDV